jgi:CHASE3 domain sensor protein
MTETLRRNVNATFGAALFLLLLIGGVCYWSVSGFLTAAAERRHGYEVRGRLNDVLAHLQDAETGQRGYLLTGEEPYLAPYVRGVASLARDVAALRRLAGLDTAQRGRLASLDALMVAKLAELNQTIELRRQRGLDTTLSIMASDRGRQLMDSVRRILAGLDATEAARTEQSDERVRVAGNIARLTIVAGILLAVAVVLVSGWPSTATSWNAGGLRKKCGARGASGFDHRADPHMVFIKDAEQLRFVRFNRAGKAAGVRADELIGRNDFDFFPKRRLGLSSRKTARCWRAERWWTSPRNRFTRATKGPGSSTRKRSPSSTRKAGRSSCLASPRTSPSSGRPPMRCGLRKRDCSRCSRSARR